MIESDGRVVLRKILVAGLCDTYLHSLRQLGLTVQSVQMRFSDSRMKVVRPFYMELRRDGPRS